MPSETTNVNVRIDKALKAQADSVLSELGMNMTTAFNIFLRQTVRQGKIPFEISLNRPSLSDNEIKARQELREAFRAIQEDSVRNGTDDMSLDDINAIIAESRQERRNKRVAV